VSRPPREDYVPVTARPAVEYDVTTSFACCRLKHFAHSLTALVLVLRCNAYDILDRLPDPMATAREIGKRISTEWPDRAYFVEVWQQGREGFAQVFQPFGVPRNPAG
jgi:hypothetical protein